jgi:hypothetical protein
MPRSKLSPCSGAFVAPPVREAEAAEVVGDAFKVPMVNNFTEGESTACQVLTVGCDGD